AIKEKTVSAKPGTPYLRPVGKMKKLHSNVNVCYLYQPGDLERGRQRATDPIWSLKPIVYLQDGPKRGFVREELLTILLNTTLPPSSSK
ncbi:unnamed protein product, partial [Porites evermanni]